MADDSTQTIQDFITAVTPVVAEATGRGERVGHLLMVLGAGRYCAEAGAAETAKTLREFAEMVERGQVQDPFQGA